MFEHEISPELRDTAVLVARALAKPVPAAVAERHQDLLRVAAMGLGGLGIATSNGNGQVAHLRPRRTRRRLVAVAVAAALALGTSVVAWASQSAVPGDPLYPVDRAAERVELALARSPKAKADVHLAQAAKRLRELSVLERRHQPKHINHTALDVARSDNDAVQDARTAPIKDREALEAHVASAVSKHTERLQELLDRLVASEGASDEAVAGLQRAIANSSRALAATGHPTPTRGPARSPQRLPQTQSPSFLGTEPDQGAEETPAPSPDVSSADNGPTPDNSFDQQEPADTPEPTDSSSEETTPRSMRRDFSTQAATPAPDSTASTASTADGSSSDTASSGGTSDLWGDGSTSSEK